MNAKEKAKELIEKYLNMEFEIGGKYGGYLKMDIFEAKECVLILVDEILHCEATEPSDTDWGAQYYWLQKKVDAGKFWGDVRLEVQSFSMKK